MADVAKLWAYRPVSRAGQIDGLGLPVQTKLIKGYARDHDARIVGWSDDPGLSGTLDQADRPGIMEILRAIKDGKCDGILMVNLGRLSRMLTIQEGILAQIWKLGGVAVTVESGI